MAKNSEGPKIYVTSRGRMYVKADEVLRSPKIRKEIKKMAQIIARKASDVSPKNST